MTSTSTILAVPLSVRDLQWLSALDAAISTLINPGATEEQVEFNIDAVEHLYDFHYSRDEALALRKRLHALLPPETPMRFHDPTLLATSQTTLFS